MYLVDVWMFAQNALVMLNGEMLTEYLTFYPLEAWRTLQTKVAQDGLADLIEISH